MKRFTARQITVIVGALSVAILAAPVAALAATGSFSSSSASKPAISATNTASGFGAKAVYGNASGGSGTEFGVYGHASSSRGYGVYSAGRLGTSGALVCSHCVTGADVNAATLPTVPDASSLGGHGASYYARIVPLSWVGTPAVGVFHGLADIGGVVVYASCVTDYDSHGVAFNRVRLSVAAKSDADDGTINYFWIWTFDPTSNQLTNANAAGKPLTAVPVQIAGSDSATQVEGTATYRRNSDGRVVTISFHLYGAGCQVFGNVLTAG